MTLLIVIQQSHLCLNQELNDANVSKLQFVPTPHAAKLMSLGFDQLMADCYWLSFISYVGDAAERRNDRYELADRYIDLVTGLDPHFLTAYWFAVFTVGDEQKRPQIAAELIERGIRANQDNWYLPYIAGINQYLYAKNELVAAKYYRQAAKYPNAPEWLARQASILEAKIPSTIKEINTWTSIYTLETDPRVRDKARHKLIELWGKVIASRPPKNIRDKAISALKDLDVNVEFFLRRMETKK